MCLALILALCGGYDDTAVRVTNQRGRISDLGSGTIVAGNGQTALVITCRHIFSDGRGVLTVERTNHQRYPAKLLGVSKRADLSALEIADPGVAPLRIAERQPPAATLIGWGGTSRAWKHRGQLIEQTGRTVFYSFSPLEGDSGGGAFDDTGALAGVVWGTDGQSGAVVPLADLRAVLDGPACSRYFTTKAATPMMPLVLAASMLGQLPPMPGKSAPLAVQPSPQGQVYAAPPQTYAAPPQTYAAPPVVQQYDVPISVRVRIIPQIDVQTVAPQPQVYAAPQAASYGGCYGGSYSGGFSAQYQQTYAAPVAAAACPGGVCVPARSTAFGRKFKYKEGPGIGLGPRGLRELFAR
jgi:hypothetical protein